MPTDHVIICANDVTRRYISLETFKSLKKGVYDFFIDAKDIFTDKEMNIYHRKSNDIYPPFAGNSTKSSITIEWQL